MTRRVLAAAILSAWAVSLALLVQRQAGPGEAELAGLDDRLPPGDAFLSISVSGRQVGIFSTALDTLPSGARTVERIDLTAADADTAIRITQGTTVGLDAALRVTGLQLIRGGDARRLRADVTPDSAGATVTVRLLSGGDTATMASPRPPNDPARTVASLLRLAGVSPEAVAASPRHLVLDPLTLDWIPADLALGGDTLLAVPDSAALDSTGTWVEARWDTVTARRFQLAAWGLPFEGLVDVDGNLVRMTTPLGAVWQRSAFEIVRAGYAPGGGGPAAEGLWLLPGVRPRTGAGVRRLVAVLTLPEGGPLPRLPDLAGPGQRRRGDTLEVHLASVQGALGTPSDHPSTAWFRGSPAHPADDARMQAQARRLMREGTDRASEAAALVRWVAREIRLEPGGPDHPLAVLQHRRASPRGKVALLVTLARAGGLPARPVAGLVWDGATFRHGGWAEIGLPGWLPVDPVLGQFPADAGRLRLAVGVPADPLVLLPFIGQVRARVLDLETRP